MKGALWETFLSKKVSQCRKKLKGGTRWNFSTSFLSPSIKKVEGGPFEEKSFLRKKSHSAGKSWKGDLLVLPGTKCYAENQEKKFWFSSLGEMVQFDTIIFRRTFEEIFWSVRLDWKKGVTIIVAFHFMNRRPKKSL